MEPQWRCEQGDSWVQVHSQAREPAALEVVETQAGETAVARPTRHNDPALDYCTPRAHTDHTANTFLPTLNTL